MKTCVLVSALAAVAGFAVSASAQTTTSSSVVTCSVEYLGDTGVYAGGTGPGTANFNGIVDPGEGALIRITIAYTGRNAIGTFSPANAQGQTTGTIRGLGGGFVDLIGAGGTAGNWDTSSQYGEGVDQGGDPQAWNYGGSSHFEASIHPDYPGVNPLSPGGSWAVPAGDGTPLGGNLLNVQFGQLPPGASSINAGGPTILGIWTGVWIPADYASRDVTFRPAPSLAAGAFPFSVLFKTVGSTSALSAFTTQNSFSPSGNIPLAPSPASLSLLGLGGLIVGRRRR